MESIGWKAIGDTSSRAYISCLTVLFCMSIELPEAVKDDFVVSFVPHSLSAACFTDSFEIVIGESRS